MNDRKRICIAEVNLNNFDTFDELLERLLAINKDMLKIKENNENLEIRFWCCEGELSLEYYREKTVEELKVEEDYVLEQKKYFEEKERLMYLKLKAKWEKSKVGA